MTGRYVTLLSLMLLASCDTPSALNALNLLGSSQKPAAAEEPGEQVAFVIPQADDGRIDITTVTNARLEYTPSGVIVRANGEPTTLGYHSAYLRPMNFGEPDGNGAIWYQFRAMPPAFEQPVGTEFTRSLSVANFIPNSRLQAVQSVTITGAQNDVTIRLR